MSDGRKSPRKINAKKLEAMSKGSSSDKASLRNEAEMALEEWKKKLAAPRRLGTLSGYLHKKY